MDVLQIELPLLGKWDRLKTGHRRSIHSKYDLRPALAKTLLPPELRAVHHCYMTTGDGTLLPPQSSHTAVQELQYILASAGNRIVESDTRRNEVPASTPDRLDIQ